MPAASLICTTRSYFSEIESGKKNPRRGVAERIAKRINLTLEELLIEPVKRDLAGARAKTGQRRISLAKLEALMAQTPAS